MRTPQQQMLRRQAIERRIVKAVVKTLLTAGFQIEVDNFGEELQLPACASQAVILQNLFLADDERLYVVKDGKNFGWVYFVYGNDGWDVINDYTVNLEQWLGDGSEVQKLTERAEVL